MPPDDAGSSWTRILKLVLAGLGLAGFVWLVFLVRGVLTPFVLAFVLAHVLAPLVDGLEGRGLNRTLSVLLVFLVLIGALSTGLVMAGGRVGEEISELSDRFTRQERVDRELAVTNSGTEAVTLGWGWRFQEGSFALIETPGATITLDPASQVPFRPSALRERGSCSPEAEDTTGKGLNFPMAAWEASNIVS